MRLLPIPLALRRRPFDHEDWLFELKWDGFRALAHVEPKALRRGSAMARTANRTVDERKGIIVVGWHVAYPWQ